MSKKSMVERNNKREKMIDKYATKRATLKSVVKDATLPLEERFQAQLKLSKLPRNSSPVRYRNRCMITGRGRGVYREFGLCRNKFRELVSMGVLPGVVKSSW